MTDIGIDEVVLFWHWRVVLRSTLPLGKSESKLRRGFFELIYDSHHNFSVAPKPLPVGSFHAADPPEGG